MSICQCVVQNLFITCYRMHPVSEDSLFITHPGIYTSRLGFEITYYITPAPAYQVLYIYDNRKHFLVTW